MALNDGHDLTGPGVFSTTPEAATAELARLNAAYRGPRASDVPTSVVEAARRLEELKADQAFRTKALNGDVAANQQVNALTAQISAGSRADLAMANVVPEGHIDSGGGASLRDQISAVETMRESGLDEPTIRQVLEDRPVSRAEYTAAELQLRTRMNTREWAARLLDGDAEAVRENRLLSVILSSQIKDD